MSFHKDCGEPIHWFPRNDEPERFYPPMEYDKTVFVNIDGALIETTGYKLHRCDPEKVKEWQKYLEAMQELKGPDSFEANLNHYVAAKEKQREDLWKQVLHVPCKSCDAEIGQICWNLTVRKKTGELVEIRWPHPSRYKDAI